MNKDINRLKVVLAEKKRTNKWLAEQLGKDPGTVSKWCTNTMQPNLETLVEIAKIMEVDIRELLIPTDTQKVIISILYLTLPNMYKQPNNTSFRLIMKKHLLTL